MASEVVINVTANDNASSGLGGIGGALSNLGNIVTGIKAGFDLLAGAFSAVVDFGSQFTEAAMEGQAAVAELEQVLKATGGAAGLTSQQLQDMASELSSVTAFSDEAVMGGQSMLLTFKNIGEDVFPRATAAMLDMGQMFGSVDAASVQLGKALNDPIAGISALSRIGVTFTEEQKKMIEGFMEAGDIASAQGVILAELEGQVGGLAEAYGQTFGGQLEIFKNRMGEVQETIGNGILPVLSTLMSYVMPLVPVIEELGGHIATVFAGLNLGLAEGNWDFFLGALDRLDGFVADLFQALANDIDTWAAGSGPQELADKIVAFFDSIGEGAGFESKALTAAGNVVAALARALGAVDWSAIGDAVDNAMGRSVDNIDWGAMGDRFGESLEAFFTGGNLFSDGGSSSTLQAVGDAISEFFVSAMGYASWEQVGQALRAGINQIDLSFNEWAADIWQGFIDGLNQLDLDAQQWVDDHIIDPIKDALGIASPSTVFMQIGKDIVLGLIGGFGSMIGTLGIVVQGIVDTVLSIFQPVLDILGFDTSGDGTIGGRTPTAPTLPGDGTPMTGGTVVNQYFAGATINVGAWDEIAYDCIYPNPFIGATGGQLGPPGGGSTSGGGR